ncbi:hypothetical protein FNV43_RR22682 [Rhamnella rubrinervis]|uniref:Uncharacterized protein n=1 Tax=Rhamnella rubrinervis TaxID=2594499 RepID=A0A8K0DRZ5_9ROSA|nr:hypothetical protein FNV43_RR22682 [Rhamnella rubrinervis]
MPPFGDTPDLNEELPPKDRLRMRGPEVLLFTSQIDFRVMEAAGLLPIDTHGASLVRNGPGPLRFLKFMPTRISNPSLLSIWDLEVSGSPFHRVIAKLKKLKHALLAYRRVSLDEARFFKETMPGSSVKWSWIGDRELQVLSFLVRKSCTFVYRVDKYFGFRLPSSHIADYYRSLFSADEVLKTDFSRDGIIPKLRDRG